MLPDTVVAYCDSTIAFPLFCEYAVGSAHNRRPLRRLIDQREALVADLVAQAESRARERRKRSEAGRNRSPPVMGTLSSELGPLAERVPNQPRVYADANMPCGVVAFMRERLGWDVLFVLEHPTTCAARATSSTIRLARQLGRTLVTLDRDYLDDRLFPPDEGAGVIVFCVPDERWLRRLLDAHGSRTVPRAGRARRCRSNGARWSGTSMLSLGLDLSERPARAVSRRRRRRVLARGRGADGAEAVRAVLSAATPEVAGVAAIRPEGQGRRRRREAS